MNLYITFSGAPYEATTQRIVETARGFGADDVWVYDDTWLLTQPFYQQNRWLWDHPHKRGFGWYAWKPYILWHALSMLEDGDVVLYTDADTFPIADLHVLYQTCRKDGGIMLFASENHTQAQWCKRDCYYVMGDTTSGVVAFGAQAGVARFMLFQKGPWRTTQFLMEWITYCVNRLANTLDRSVLGSVWDSTRVGLEMPGFIEHRAEQAIMTNLAHTYGLNLYREACEAGNGIDRDRGLYGQLFSQVNADEAKVSHEPKGSVFFNISVSA